MVSTTLSASPCRIAYGYQEYLPRERLSLIFLADHSGGDRFRGAIPLERTISRLPSCGLSLKIF